MAFKIYGSRKIFKILFMFFVSKLNRHRKYIEVEAKNNIFYRKKS